MKPRSPGGMALNLLDNQRAPSVRDRRVAVRSVACPNCKAPEGYPCVSSTGKPTNHPSRRRMALRAETTAYSLADVTYAQQMRTYTRRALRERAGLTVRDLAAQLGFGYDQLRRWEVGLSSPTGHDAATYGAWLRERMELLHPTTAESATS